MLIGIIADTHGMLRREALASLQGSNMILHAGDAGKEEVLTALRELAPLYAVRGNVDHGSWADELPLSVVIEAEGKLLYMHHGHHELDLDPAAAGFAAVISGHSHRPAIYERNGVLYINPGSAGPRRFALPVTLAHLMIDGDKLEASLVELDRS